MISGGADTICIVNPNSANGSTGKYWRTIEKKIRAELGDCKAVLTEYPGHATKLAAEAVKLGAKLIVSVGGDGTLNEVVNGIVQASNVDLGHVADCALAMIPRGTGGDYRKTFAIEKDVEAAIERIKRGKFQLVDVGRAEFLDENGKQIVRYFANIMSFGVSGLVDYYCNHTTKAFGGKISFFVASVRALMKWRNRDIHIVIDDGVEDTTMKVQMIAVAIGRFFGGGMMIAPTADPSDGLFDIVAMKDFSLWESLTREIKVYKGEHIGDPKVELWRGKKLYAEPVSGDEPVFIDMDGEVPGKLPVSVEILPRVLKLVV